MEVKGFPDSVTQATVAKVFGVSRQTVAGWQCPQNEDGTYCLRKIAAHRKEQFDEALEAARGEVKGEDVLLKKASRRLKELDLAKKMGELITRENADANLENALNIISTTLNVLADALPAKLEGRTPIEMKVALQDSFSTAVERMIAEYQGEG